MEFSRTKVLIYVLTFLGYVFSGYGSGVVDNVRDAVIFAEEYLGQFLKNAVDLVKTLGEAFRMLEGSDDNCRFSCPSGEPPVKNKYFKPGYNSRSPDLSSQFLSFPAMKNCYLERNLCYQTCNSQKSECDERFKQCLYTICSDVTSFVSNPCKAAASVISSFMKIGCSSFLASQERGCFCSEDSKKNKFKS